MGWNRDVIAPWDFLYLQSFHAGCGVKTPTRGLLEENIAWGGRRDGVKRDGSGLFWLCRGDKWKVVLGWNLQTSIVGTRKSFAGDSYVRIVPQLSTSEGSRPRAMCEICVYRRDF